MADAGIIRARAKIEATIRGAQIFREMEDRGESFGDFCWSFTDGKVLKGGGRSSIASSPLLRANLQGDEAPRLQVRRPDDRLRLDAGRRHRQRPFHPLLPARRSQTSRATSIATPLALEVEVGQRGPTAQDPPMQGRTR